jgi:hypothetical protein
MAGITTNLSILTLLSMDPTTLSKDTIWEIELKRKIQQSVVYRRLTLLTEIHTGLE